MPVHATEVELRGVLDTISNRFYTGGWGWGTLYTDQGIVRITGALEGHVAGTSLVVRGAYKDTAYGRQLDCSSIMVDAVSGNLEVIRSWLRRYCPEVDEDLIVRICKPLKLDARWPLLVDAHALVRAGLGEELAAALAASAANYLLMIELKKGLMEKGFTDQEADRLLLHYRDDVNAVLEADCFRATIERVVAFHRIDLVLGQGHPRNHARRLQAAMVQALVGAMRNGHTARLPTGVYREAAELAGVYPETVKAVDIPREVIAYEGLLQLRSVAYCEQDIATWVVEAMKRS